MILQRLTAWLAGRQGLELHYPPRTDPPLEPAETLANDGTPGARPPARPTRYEPGELEQRAREVERRAGEVEQRLRRQARGEQ